MSDFEIDGQPYSFADSYTFGDALVIRACSGLEMSEFAELVEAIDGDDLEAKEAAQADTRLLVAMIAVAVARAHPRWPVSRVADFIRACDVSTITFAEVEPVEEEATDQRPPAGDLPAPADSAGVAGASPASAQTSSAAPDSASDETSPSLSGALT